MFTKDNAAEYGKRSSRKNVPNKSNAKLKESISKLLDDNFENLQKDLDSLKVNEKITAIISLLKYALPTLKSVELDATIEGESNNGELINKLFKMSEGDFDKAIKDE